MAYYHLKVRRDTAANWAANNPTPYEAEICYETDTKKLKIGDGSTAYNSLTYFTLPAATTSAPGLMSAADKTKLNGITISLYAKINSPAFTGIPTAPSIPNPYNIGSQQIANLDHVQQAIAFSRSLPTIAIICSVGAGGDYTILSDSVVPFVQALSVNGKAQDITRKAKLQAGDNVVEITFRDYTTPLYRNKIPDNAFADILIISEAVLSPDVVEIGEKAFCNSSVAIMYCPGAAAPKIGDDAFTGSTLEATGNVYVPVAATDDYTAKWNFGCTIYNF